MLRSHLQSDFTNTKQHVQMFRAVFFCPMTRLPDFHSFCLMLFTFHTSLLERVRVFMKILYLFIRTKTPI